MQFKLCLWSLEIIILTFEHDTILIKLSTAMVNSWCVHNMNIQRFPKKIWNYIFYSISYNCCSWIFFQKYTLLCVLFKAYFDPMIHTYLLANHLFLLATHFLGCFQHCLFLLSLIKLATISYIYLFKTCKCLGNFSRFAVFEKRRSIGEPPWFEWFVFIFIKFQLYMLCMKTFSLNYKKVM